MNFFNDISQSTILKAFEKSRIFPMGGASRYLFHEDRMVRITCKSELLHFLVQDIFPLDFPQFMTCMLPSTWWTSFIGLVVSTSTIPLTKWQRIYFDISSILCVMLILHSGLLVRIATHTVWYTMDVRDGEPSLRGYMRLLEWTSYQICKIADCAWAGNAGYVFPATKFQGNR